MRPTLVLFIPFFTIQVYAQNGPGGVGSATNNVLWLNADKGITRTGSAVTQWADQSGNGRIAYKPGPIPFSEPTFVASSVNGYPSLDFDGTDDQLWIPDNNALDLNAWHIFIVVKADLQKNHNAWLVKGADGSENYELLSYDDGNIHTPILYTTGVRTYGNTAGGNVTTAGFNIIEYSYASAVGRDVYKNGTSTNTDNENLTPRTNAFDLYIGNERGVAGRNMDGKLSEVIMYNAPLNAAQRIVTNNYLAAKFGLALASDDLYVQDTPGNGNFDHEVCGIGRVNATNIQSDSRGSGIIRINNASNLGNNEFLFWGHNNLPLGAWGVTDFPASTQGRLARVWRVSEVSNTGTAIDVGNVDITFDLNGMGAVTANDLRLLVDTDNDGIFADEIPIAGAINTGSGNYRFAAVSALVNGRRFTLGTINNGQTPLPIELLSFTATDSERVVRLDWATASEVDNANFMVERSIDLLNWEGIIEVAGAGNSQQRLDYVAFDNSPMNGTSYYRLRQTDADGSSELSTVVAITRSVTLEARIYPMPFQERIVIETLNEQLVSVDLFNVAGQRITVPMDWGAERVTLDTVTLPVGTYVIHVQTEKGTSTTAIVKGE